MYQEPCGKIPVSSRSKRLHLEFDLGKFVKKKKKKNPRKKMVLKHFSK